MRTMWKSAALRPMLMLTLPAAVVILGCKPAAPARQPAAPLPPTALTSPLDAARTLLLTLRAERDAIGAKDSAAAAAAQKQLASIAASETIRRRWSAGPAQLANPTDAPQVVANHWGMIVAFYLDGIDLDAMRRQDVGDKLCYVLIPARGKTGTTATIRIECNVERNEWHVSKIDYQTGTIASRATSQPASQSS